jgi:hypothetical protein
LRQCGLAIQLYTQDYRNRLPEMRDQTPEAYTNSLKETTRNPTNVYGPELVLKPYLGNTRVLKCVSDREQLFETTGSSYSWNSLLNGQNAEQLSVFEIQFESHQMPLMFDKEKFHAARGDAKAQNFLYADGHIKNLLAIEGTIQRKKP